MSKRLLYVLWTLIVVCSISQANAGWFDWFDRPKNAIFGLFSYLTDSRWVTKNSLGTKMQELRASITRTISDSEEKIRAKHEILSQVIRTTRQDHEGLAQEVTNLKSTWHTHHDALRKDLEAADTLLKTTQNEMKQCTDADAQAKKELQEQITTHKKLLDAKIQSLLQTEKALREDLNNNYKHMSPLLSIIRQEQLDRIQTAKKTFSEQYDALATEIDVMKAKITSIGQKVQGMETEVSRSSEGIRLALEKSERHGVTIEALDRTADELEKGLRAVLEMSKLHKDKVQTWIDHYQPKEQTRALAPKNNSNLGRVMSHNFGNNFSSHNRGVKALPSTK